MGTGACAGIAAKTEVGIDVRYTLEIVPTESLGKTDSHWCAIGAAAAEVWIHPWSDVVPKILRLAHLCALSVGP